MARRYWRLVLPILLPIALIAYFLQRNDSEQFPTKYWYQLWPLSWPRRVENFNFKDTPEEQLCWNGTILRINADGASRAVPKIVHITWGLKGDGAFNLALYLSIKSALVSIQPDAVKLHYSYLDRENEYFKRLENSLTLVYHDPKEFSRISTDWHVAHMSDVIRLQALHDDGGIYLDSDVYVFRSFDNLLEGARDVVMAHEGGNRYGLCNAIIISKQKSAFVSRWLDEYDAFAEQDWNYHSVVLPKKLANEHPDELCALSPTAFFWPLWTPSHVDYMFSELSEEEAEEIKNQVRRNGGGLYENQLAYHAWSHNSFDKYVQELTPEIIKTRETRFNILVRRFLDGDSWTEPF